MTERTVWNCEIEFEIVREPHAHGTRQVMILSATRDGETHTRNLGGRDEASNMVSADSTLVAEQYAGDLAAEFDPAVTVPGEDAAGQRFWRSVLAQAERLLAEPSGESEGSR